MSPEATARPVSTEGSQARLVSQSWNSQEGQVGWNWKTRFKQKITWKRGTGKEGQVGSELEKIIKPNKSVYVELTTDTNVALDISGISLGGGESPVRFKLGLKRSKRIM